MASQSPATVRLFPLTGTLLLPGTFLPLNVFETRYRQLVADAMRGDRRIGMIQPFVPADDNSGPPLGEDRQPALYPVGCLGEVVECEPQDDGRYWIVLKGESRFRVVEELSVTGGYRQVLADCSTFSGDHHELDCDLEIGQLLAYAERYCTALELDFDLDLLASLPPAQAVNALSAALPLAPAEKQALLEAAAPDARGELLIRLMEIQDVATSDRPAPYVLPTVH